MSVHPQELADAALDALPVAVVIADGTGTVLRRNRVADQLLPEGDRLDEILGCVEQEGGQADWPAELSQLAGSCSTMVYSELRLDVPDGGTRLVDVSLSSLDAATSMALVVVEDVTDRASMARRLATTERMAAVGRLAARVAHELNNPLDGILRFLGLAERAGDRGDGAAAREYLQKTRAGVKRMAEIIAELLDYSRVAGRQFERIGVEGAIQQALDAMAPHLEAAAVTVVCDVNVGDGCTVPGELFQVLCNLIKNSVDAMASGGRLTLAAACADGCEVITVTDTGAGVEPEVMDKVFDPFFTTKDVRSGTGLGLSICRDIVTRAGGTISIANAPTGGAVATVTVPHRRCRMEKVHE